MRVRQLSMVTVFFILTGCGSGDSPQARLNKAIPDRTSVVPLSGVVSIDGKPRGALMIRLIIEGQDAPDPKTPKVVSDPEGKFEFTTYLKGDGVPVGNYRVIVEELTRSVAGGWSGPDKLENRFNHLEEPAATVNVQEGTPQKDLKIALVAEGKKSKPAPKYASKQQLGKPKFDKNGRAG